MGQQGRDDLLRGAEDRLEEAQLAPEESAEDATGLREAAAQLRAGNLLRLESLRDYLCDSPRSYVRCAEIACAIRRDQIAMARRCFLGRLLLSLNPPPHPLLHLYIPL